jgi:hypothetical protein
MAPPCRLFEHKTDKIFKEEPINRKQGANRYERIKTLVPVQRIFGLRNDGTRLVSPAQTFHKRFLTTSEVWAWIRKENYFFVLQGCLGNEDNKKTVEQPCRNNIWKGILAQ